MTSNLADRRSYVNKAQRRLIAMTPQTPEWHDAQRDAVHARADYWGAMCEEWDFRHPKLTSSRRPFDVT